MDHIRFEVTGATYGQLVDQAHETLLKLTADAPGQVVELDLEIEPETEEMGAAAPVTWTAHVSAVFVNRPTERVVSG